MRQHRTEVWARWCGLVSEQHESGKSVAEFCRERGVATSQLFAWKRRVREADAAHPRDEELWLGTPGAQFVSVEVASVAETKRPASVMRSGAIEVRLGGGRSLVVEPGLDGHHLRALLSALEA